MTMNKNHYECLFGNYLTRKGYYIEIYNVETREQAIKKAEKELLKRHNKAGWYLDSCNQIWC